MDLFMGCTPLGYLFLLKNITILSHHHYHSLISSSVEQKMTSHQGICRKDMFAQVKTTLSERWYLTDRSPVFRNEQVDVCFCCWEV